jgi:hypothetical protein
MALQRMLRFVEGDVDDMNPAVGLLFDHMAALTASGPHPLSEAGSSSNKDRSHTSVEALRPIFRSGRSASLDTSFEGDTEGDVYQDDDNDDDGGRGGGGDDDHDERLVRLAARRDFGCPQSFCSFRLRRDTTTGSFGLELRTVNYFVNVDDPAGQQHMPTPAAGASVPRRFFDEGGGSSGSSGSSSGGGWEEGSLGASHDHQDGGDVQEVHGASSAGAAALTPNWIPRSHSGVHAPSAGGGCGGSGPEDAAAVQADDDMHSSFLVVVGLPQVGLHCFAASCWLCTAVAVAFWAIRLVERDLHDPADGASLLPVVLCCLCLHGCVCMRPCVCAGVCMRACVCLIAADGGS